MNSIRNRLAHLKSIRNNFMPFFEKTVFILCIILVITTLFVTLSALEVIRLEMWEAAQFTMKGFVDYLLFWLILNALSALTFALTGIYIAQKPKTNWLTVAIWGAGLLSTVFLPATLEASYLVSLIGLERGQILQMCDQSTEKIR